MEATSKAFDYPVLQWRAIDGDTVEAVIDLGFYLSHKVVIRLQGIDAPELANPEQRPAALRVLEAVRVWLSTNRPELRAVSLAPDKYGRTMGDFFNAKGQTLTGHLLSKGLVRPYQGEARGPWEPAVLDRIIATT